MAVPKFYESTDIEAPVLSGSVGSLIEVLNAVLVDGYGSKPGAGWVKEYSTENQVVYRSAGGRVLHFQDDGSRIDARFARVRGAANATGPSVSDLSNPHPLDADLTWLKSGTLDTTPALWKIAATDNQLWLFASGGQVTNGFDTYKPFFAGYIIPAIPGDLSNFLVMGYGVTASGGTNEISCLVNIHHLYRTTGSRQGSLAIAADGTTHDVNAGVMAAPCEGNQAQTTTTAQAGSDLYPASTFGGLTLNRLWSYERAGQMVRGVIPGLFLPHVKVWAGGNRPSDPWEPLQLDIGLGPRTYRMVPVTSWYTSISNNVGQNASFYLDIDSDWSEA